uniref:Vasculin n=1 Tax=Jaculus jaculus TaxID=51337 RepID=A0A8C5K0R7_JACJA
MAQHDFAPAWLNFPTPPSSTKSSLNFEKHSENFSWTENHYDVSCRRHNSSDGFDSGIGRSSGGNFGRKEKKKGWRTHGRNGTENINHRGGYHGGNSRSRSSIFHSGRSQRLQENNIPDNETGRKEDKRERKQFEAEDFPSLKLEYEREPNQNKSLAAGVGPAQYPPNPPSRAPRMLVIKKGNAKDLQLSAFPVAGNLQSQPVKNGTGPSVYSGLVPKPAQWKSQTKENKVGTSFPHESTYGVGNFNAFKSAAKSTSPSTNSVRECNRSNSASPVDKLNQQPRLTKLTRMRTDKEERLSESLEKRQSGGGAGGRESRAGSGKDEESFNLHNSNSTHQERNRNRNFDENEVPQENGNASVISQQVIRSSTFSQTDVLSSSLEAEHRLLKEMGWQEDSENDETCAPLTEDEMREFQVISEHILKNGLICDFKFGPWKNSTFTPTLENEDTETE